MDVYFVLNGITFVWDDEKARINPINHNSVTFQQAAEVFFDPFLRLLMLAVTMKREMPSLV